MNTANPHLTRVAIRNISADWLLRIVSIPAFMLTAPILINQLGNEQYGIWITLGQVMTFATFLDLGIPHSLAILLARQRLTDDASDGQSTLDTAWVILLSWAAVTLAGGLMLAPRIPSLFDVKPESSQLATSVFVLGMATSCVLVPLRIGRGILQAWYRSDVLSKSELTLTIGRLLVILMVFGTGHGNVVTLAALAFLWTTVCEISLLILGYRTCGYRRPRFQVGRSAIRDVMTRGLTNCVSVASRLLGRHVLILCVGTVLGLAATPAFAIGSSIIIMAGQFILSIGNTLFPIASSLYSQKNIRDLRRIALYGVRYSIALAAPAAAFLLLFRFELLSLWLGRTRLSGEQIASAADVMAILCFPLLLATPHFTTRSLLTSSDRHFFVSCILLLSSFVGAGTAYGLMKYADLGLRGAAIGTAIGMLLGDGLIFPVRICRQIDCGRLSYIRTVYLRPALAFAGCLSVAELLRIWLPHDSLIGLAACGSTYAIATAPLCVFLCVKSEHRRQLYESLRTSLGN